MCLTTSPLCFVAADHDPLQTLEAPPPPPSNPFAKAAPRALATTRLVVAARDRWAALCALMIEHQAAACRRVLTYREQMIDYTRQRDEAEVCCVRRVCGVLVGVSSLLYLFYFLLLRQLRRRYMGVSASLLSGDKLAPPSLLPVPTLLTSGELETVVRRALAARDARREATRAALADIAKKEAELESQVMMSRARSHARGPSVGGAAALVSPTAVAGAAARGHVRAPSTGVR